jgi:sensor c-di-GMP phosphodiesterase-like protein
VAVLVAACAIAGPIGAALYLARQQGERDEVAALPALAGELLRMAALKRSQFDGAVTALADTAAQPCSEAAISIMRRVAVASTFVQGVGHVRDGRLVCSSFGIRSGCSPRSTSRSIAPQRTWKARNSRRWSPT